MLTPHHLTCEYFTNPIGLDVPNPRLSWQSKAAQRGALQTAYQIQVTANDQTVLWDSGVVRSSASLHIPYAGDPLQPGQRCDWRVRVWDEEGAVSDWSEAAFWEMGLLTSANWQANWFTPDWEEDTTQPPPAPLLRRSFTVDGEVVAARIYATSLGVYELRLNGQRVGDAVLAPGWTSYKRRIQYQTYDVTGLVQRGENALGALLGDGWYRGFLGFQNQRNLYGKHLALLLQLHITYVDGRTAVITSDEAWKAITGPIRMADLYWAKPTMHRKRKRAGTAQNMTTAIGLLYGAWTIPKKSWWPRLRPT